MKNAGGLNGKEKKYQWRYKGIPIEESLDLWEKSGRMASEVGTFVHAQTENYAGKNKNGGKRYRNRKHLLKVKQVCQNCGKEFYPKNNGQTYCSIQCSHEVLSKRPQKEELENLVRSYSNIAIGKMLGVSDTSVRKWKRYYGI